MKKYRLRYAPSPTGFLHIGNTRTALMAFLFAKHYDGTFIVRIEDTDLERNVDGAIESQFNNLDWLGIKADESIYQPGLQKYGAYLQSQKFPRYREMAEKLVQEGKAYYCFCTEEELDQDYQKQKSQGIVATKYNGQCSCLTTSEIEQNLKANKPYTIRFKVPNNHDWTMADLVRGPITFQSKDLGDFVIIKANGVATYNFAVVIDDHDMEISHVVRGEEHISNTPRQMMIYDAFGWEYPEFAHLTLIVDETGKKLSKRSGNALFFIEQYRKQGYLPDAIFNYIALLGWSPKGEKELLTPPELVSHFDEKRFSKSPSTFDMKKLRWINSQYLKKLSEEDYLTFIKPFIDSSRFNWKTKHQNWIDHVLKLYQKELEYGEQINDHLGLFFEPQTLPLEVVINLKNLDDFTKLISYFEKEIRNLEPWTVESIQQLIKKTGVATNSKGKNLFMPLRSFTTRAEHGPALADNIFLLGKEQVLKNISETTKEFLN
ncbi:glutamyl-tRNA synthetase/nondiscriminating glutamyl-tRNA synthetase [Entomoplasma freundtii]|uniref:Glutamate--tRNA ligase n=1 Tax=Entomoplasma freundtii TaxID=74700 RepID=A0A2K8NQI5_9MOLU|nr:glutamate--tRNA ligase [Entomoplasma freundtii]ATZ16100.1 glutamyl-tRNA synthetase [Entomoplasma freundtii]TDY56999.1 glutamyl-tRNA synthetase/nondiscriminating glutamyl-tRNA synthetase [Entomoplasma freundtii]